MANTYLQRLFLLLQTVGTLVLHATIPLTYLLGYSYFVFMDAGDQDVYQVCMSIKIEGKTGFRAAVAVSKMLVSQKKADKI